MRMAGMSLAQRGIGMRICLTACILPCASALTTLCHAHDEIRRGFICQ